jgi:LPXTG-motif cell wall-anchored protein
MNRKQLILLLVALAVIGGAGLVLLKRNQKSWTESEAQIGQKLSRITSSTTSPPFTSRATPI